MEFYKIACPFCKKETVTVVHRPPTVINKRVKGSGTTKSSSFRTKDEIKVISGCSSCKASKEDVEKAFKQGKQPSHEEVIRRLKEAGLPTKIVSKS